MPVIVYLKSLKNVICTSVPAGVNYFVENVSDEKFALCVSADKGIWVWFWHVVVHIHVIFVTFFYPD